jgi:hypothetical protein
MDHSEYSARQWRSLIETLEAFRAGRLGVAEACRKVVESRAALEADDNELFLPFVGIDSETDAFPLGEVRKHWSPTGLARADAERSAAEEHYRNYALSACGALIEYARRHAL